MVLSTRIGYKILKHHRYLDANTDLQEFAKASYASGTKLVEAGSEFLGFAAKVHSHGEVEQVYRHLKLRYMQSIQVMMGYRLPGTNKAYDEGSKCLQRCNQFDAQKMKNIKYTHQLEAINHAHN